MSKKVDSLEAKIGQGTFDMVWPVGAVYVQYPQQDDPATLFNNNGIKSTWSVIDYDGAFFRAEGGKAEEFINKNRLKFKQVAQLPNITGTAYAMIHSKAENKWIGALSTFKDGTSDGNRGDIRGTRGQIDFNASIQNSTYVNGGEVRPANYTVRVWKRTA